MNPAHFVGHMYQAAGWQHLGRTKGFARANGRYTDPHGQPKDLYVQPLRRDAQRHLRDPAPLPDRFAAHPGGGACSRRLPELRSLYEELQAVPDFPRAQGRKHTIASVLTIQLLARLAGLHGGRASADYAKSPIQDELQAVGAWRNPQTQQYEPPSKSVIYRVLTQADPAALEAVLRRYAMPRLRIGAAVAADGKRIRGANRNGPDRNETVTLVVHGTGLPLASLGFHDENGEIAAVQTLLETVPLHGRVITIDALHTVRNTARLIVETHAAHYLMTVKANAEKTYATLAGLDWDQFATGCHADPEEKAHGRIERRRIQTLTPPPGTVNYPHLQQIFRIQRERRSVKTSQVSRETVYGITSVPASQAGPQQLLAWNRGHWTVENQNHRTRDVHFDEDACLARTGHAMAAAHASAACLHACLARTGHAPVHNALCNCLAIAVLLQSGRGIAEGKRHFQLYRKAAFQAVLGARGASDAPAGTVRGG